jgi:hypothetical protein
MPTDYHFTAHLEAFGEPRTIPGGWDLSGMLAPRPPEGDGHVPDPRPLHPTQPQMPATPEKFDRVHPELDNCDYCDMV